MKPAARKVASARTAAHIHGGPRAPCSSPAKMRGWRAPITSIKSMPREPTFVFFLFLRTPFLHRLGSSPRKPWLRGAAGHGRHTSHLYPGGHRLCEVQLAGRQPASGEARLTCICRKLTQGRERTVGMAAPARWVKVAARTDMATWDRSADQRAGWTRDEPGPLAPWLARGRARRRLPRQSTGPRPRRPRPLRAKQLRVCPLFARRARARAAR